MTLSLIVGAALGVLALPFAIVGSMYWMLFLLRSLHGLQASMRAFREEMRSYHLWRETPAAPRPLLAPPADYGPEPVDDTATPHRREALEREHEEQDRRLRYRGVPPWARPEPAVDTGPTAFTEPERPAGDFDDFEPSEAAPAIAPGSKLAAPAPPRPGGS